jgi:hypothetical protein
VALHLLFRANRSNEDGHVYREVAVSLISLVDATDINLSPVRLGCCPGWDARSIALSFVCAGAVSVLPPSAASLR